MLNILAITYLETRDESDFNRLYSVFNALYGGKYSAIARRLNIDIYEIQAAYEDTLLRALNYYQLDKGKFTNYLNSALRITLIELRRQRDNRRVEILVDDEIISIIPDKTNLENEIIELFNFRRLIQQAAITDHKTLVALQKVYEGESIHKAAQDIGMCHKTIKRRLQKLVRMCG